MKYHDTTELSKAIRPCKSFKGDCVIRAITYATTFFVRPDAKNLSGPSSHTKSNDKNRIHYWRNLSQLELKYEAVFCELMEYAHDCGAFPNHDKVWQSYLPSTGCIDQPYHGSFVRQRCPRTSDGKLIKLRDWDFDGIAIVKNSGHLTCVKHGVLYDDFDCRYRPVNSYWELVTNC
jgi:hypothetical protein